MAQFVASDGFGQSRRRASELALEDVRAGRARRSRSDLVEVLLAGRHAPPEIEEELVCRYLGTFSALASSREPLR